LRRARALDLDHPLGRSTESSTSSTRAYLCQLASFIIVTRMQQPLIRMRTINSSPTHPVHAVGTTAVGRLGHPATQLHTLASSSPVSAACFRSCKQRPSTQTLRIRNETLPLPPLHAHAAAAWNNPRPHEITLRYPHHPFTAATSTAATYTNADALRTRKANAQQSNSRRSTKTAGTAAAHQHDKNNTAAVCVCE
jgi:hypothetical protein